MKATRVGILSILGIVCVWTGAAADDLAETTADPQRALASWLDRRFEERWKLNGVAPPAVVDDATFLRRVYLDLGGTIPSVSQTRDFLTNETANKREKVIDQLLADPRCPKHLARVWRRMMVPGNGPDAARATTLLEPWLVEQFAANTHYNRLARQVLVVSPQIPVQPIDGPGQMGLAPSAAAYRAVVGQTPDALAGASTRFFLGVNLNCAKCHDHPFAQWKQKDFWGMAAFFANSESSGVGEVRSEKGDLYRARFLGGAVAEIPPGQRPEEVLADWMTSPTNPNFGATAVNRVWEHLYGRGAVSEIDDLDRVPAEERAFFLDELGRRFAATDYDLRWLLVGLCNSRTYQRETPGKSDPQHGDPIANRPLKSLIPEQVFDSLEQALNLPIGKNDDSPRTNGMRAQMLAKLNEAAANHPDQFRSGIPQALILMHGSMISNATDIETSRTLRAVVEAPFFEPTQKIETLYMATLTRKPHEQELKSMLAYLDERPAQQQQQAYAEIFWALLNSPEFVLSP